MNKIKVHIDKSAPSSYEIHIGYQIMDRMAIILAKQGWARRYFLLTDSRVSALHGERVLSILRGMGLTVEEMVFPGGEEQKSIHTLTGLAEQMMERGADRTSGLCLPRASMQALRSVATTRAPAG